MKLLVAALQIKGCSNREEGNIRKELCFVSSASLWFILFVMLREVTLSNIIIRSKDLDTRPGIVVNDVSQFSFAGLRYSIILANPIRLIQVIKSRNGVIKNSLKHYPSKSFVQKDQLSVNIVS
jgi:hypothetical protein